MKELKTDEDYQSIRRQKNEELEAKRFALSADEAGLVQELNELGLSIKSVWDLVNNAPNFVPDNSFIDTYERAYSVLVKHLSIEHHPRIREGILYAHYWKKLPNNRLLKL